MSDFVCSHSDGELAGPSEDYLECIFCQAHLHGRPEPTALDQLRALHAQMDMDVEVASYASNELARIITHAEQEQRQHVLDMQRIILMLTPAPEVASGRIDPQEEP